MKYGDFLKQERKCPFCNPENDTIIKENDTAYITYAIAPYHSDHLLICPKNHTEHFLEITQKEIDDMNVLQKDGLIALEKLGYSDTTVLFRNGIKSGKSVGHFHYHIIPSVKLVPVTSGGDERSVLTEQEQKDTVEKIKAVID